MSLVCPIMSLVCPMSVWLAAFQAGPGGQTLELPQAWPKVAETLAKTTQWQFECPDFAGQVPGPAMVVDGKRVLQMADLLASRLNRSVVVNAAGKTIRLAPMATGGRWVAAHSGSFRLVAKGVGREEDFANPVEGTRRTLKVELGWETDTNPLLVPAVWEEVLIRSVDGQEWVEKVALGLREPDAQREMQVPLPSLKTAGLTEEWSAKLTGRVVLAQKMVEVGLGPLGDVFARVKRGSVVGAQEGAFACKLVAASKNGRRISLGVRVERDPAGPGLESYQSWVVLNRLWLVDKLGEEVRPIGQVLEREDERAAEVTYHLLLPEGTEARPREIRYRTLTGIRGETVQFQLKGLPALP